MPSVPLRRFAALAVLAAAAACAPHPQPHPAAPPVAGTLPDAAARVTSVADEYLAAWIDAYPDRALLAGLSVEGHDRLSDISAEGRLRWQAREDAWLAELESLDGVALWGTPEWITYGLLRERLEAARGLRVCRQELWTANQMSGWQVWLPRLAQLQLVETPELRARALARWGALPAWLATDLENLREGLRLGYSTPRRNVRQVVAQLDALVRDPAPLRSPAERAGDAGFAAAWDALLAAQIVPAMRAYRDFLAGEYLAAAREAPGVAANPDGAACWHASFRSYATLERPAEETRRLGEARVARNLAEARRIAAEHFGTDDLDAVRRAVEADPASYFGSREEMLAFSREVVERGRAETPRWFGRMPRADVVVEPHPEYLEATASDQYLRAPEDGSRPAIWRTNLRRPGETGRFATERIAVHEAFPGHHLQIGIAAELPGAHPVGRVMGTSGVIEGWARYAEALAEEMGLYREPYAPIARRMWPARGMVVDPALHLMGWTWEEAVEYVLASGTMSRTAAEALIDRVVVWPAQLTSYDTGGLDIFALRALAERERGERFDIRAFHDAVLGHGLVTLPMLKEIVGRWIAEGGAAP
jgi:uncharacterized protein (DUF885 family)